jgi:hypothetical protein
MRLAAALVLVLLAGPAFAQHAPPAEWPLPTERLVMRLDFNGVRGCSDPETFTLSLVPRVHGWDPIEPDAAWRLVVTVRRRPRGYEGYADVYDPSGKVAWARSIPPKPTCHDLLDTLSLVFAFWVDPPEWDLKPKAEPAKPAPEPPAKPPPPPLPPPPPVPLPAFAPPEAPPKVKTPLAFRFGTGVWADLISSDRGSFGLTLDAGVRYGWFSVAGEARGDPPLGATSISIKGSAVTMRFARVTGALLLCGHYDVLVGCLKGQVGRILFPGTAPPESAQPYAAAGVRVGLEWPVVPPHFLLRLDAELLAPINLASYAIQGTSVFQVAGWNAGLGVGGLFALGRP